MRILVLCWTTYLIAYLCRLNFASALIKISDGLRIENHVIAIIPSIYFIVYAFGQLVNGFIGDRINPYTYIGVGLAMTAAVNILISCSHSYVMILFLWSVNGFSQSMFWGPLLRILSWNFDKTRHKLVATNMAISNIVATIISWSVLGTALVDSRWQDYFSIPGLIAMGFLTLWLLYAKPYSVNLASDEPPKSNSIRKAIEFLFQEKLYYICFLCFCLGFIKEGLAAWAPTIFMQSLGLDSEQSLWYLMSVPIANFIGLIIVRRVLSRAKDNNRRTMMIMLALMGLSAVMLLVFGIRFPALNITFISLITALANGAIWIIISPLPLAFTTKGMVSTVGGLFDFSIYMGASLAAVVMGFSIARFGWIFIPSIWVVFAIVAIILCLGTAGRCLVYKS